MENFTLPQNIDALVRRRNEILNVLNANKSKPGFNPNNTVGLPGEEVLINEFFEIERALRGEPTWGSLTANAQKPIEPSVQAAASNIYQFPTAEKRN
ncbi:MAG: hypothetical protein FWE38_00750 [Firmicutes bacterium]|nr:hypothetical protein [Bacillota bacterium]